MAVVVGLRHPCGSGCRTKASLIGEAVLVFMHHFLDVGRP